MRNARVAVTLAFPVLLMLPGGCEDGAGSSRGPETGETYGPLAVMPTPETGMDELLSGTLAVGDKCVTIRTGVDGEEYLLAWPEHAMTWDSESQTIHFTADRRTSLLADGDEVELRGGGRTDRSSSKGDSGESDSFEWVSEPDPSCPRKTWWVAGV